MTQDTTTDDDTTTDEAPNNEHDQHDDHDTTDDQHDTFPREYVEKLRAESAKYRQRAGRSDELATRLHTALVAATGRLADPTDLPFNEAHLDDEDTLAAALDDLLARKPHLAARKVTGDIGQGTTDTGGVDLAAILRRAAG